MQINKANFDNLSVNISLDGEGFHVLALNLSDNQHSIIEKIINVLSLSNEDEFELYPVSQLNFTNQIGFSYQELSLYAMSQIQIAMLNPYRGELIDQVNYEQQSALHDIMHSDFRDIAVDHVIRRKYKCFYTSCRKTFEDTQSLFYHQKIHTNNKPFECPQCHKRFISKTHLRSHSDIHLVNRPYKCNFRGCSKSYSKLNRLQTHLRTHTSEKIFKCPVAGCLKSFNEKGILKTHLRIHTGDKPYKCTFLGCKEMYSTKSILQEHLKKVHGENNDSSDQHSTSTFQTSQVERQPGPLPRLSTQSLCDLKLNTSFNTQSGLDFIKEEEKKVQSSKTLLHYSNLPNFKIKSNVSELSPQVTQFVGINKNLNIQMNSPFAVPQQNRNNSCSPVQGTEGKKQILFNNPNTNTLAFSFQQQHPQDLLNQQMLRQKEQILSQQQQALLMKDMLQLNLGSFHGQLNNLSPKQIQSFNQSQNFNQNLGFKTPIQPFNELQSSIYHQMGANQGVTYSNMVNSLANQNPSGILNQESQGIYQKQAALNYMLQQNQTQQQQSMFQQSQLQHFNPYLICQQQQQQHQLSQFNQSAQNQHIQPISRNSGSSVFNPEVLNQLRINGNISHNSAVSSLQTQTNFINQHQMPQGSQNFQLLSNPSCAQVVQSHQTQ